MSIGWFVDGSYLTKVWGGLWGPRAVGQETPRLNYLKLRNLLESRLSDQVDEAYYLNADPDPPTAKTNAFHNALAYPPPTGPGLRVKLYWLAKRQLFWPSYMGGGPVVHPVTGQQFELS